MKSSNSLGKLPLASEDNMPQKGLTLTYSTDDLDEVFLEGKFENTFYNIKNTIFENRFILKGHKNAQLRYFISKNSLVRILGRFK